MDQLTSLKLAIYYDGLCPLCSREIEIYQRKDTNRKIRFVDITSSDFEPQNEGLDPHEVHKVFHVKTKNGEILKGISAFVAIWDELSIFKTLSFLAKSSLGRPLFNLAYYSFAKLRPFLPRKKCDTGTCNI